MKVAQHEVLGGPPLRGGLAFFRPMRPVRGRSPTNVLAQALEGPKGKRLFRSYRTGRDFFNRNAALRTALLSLVPWGLVGLCRAKNALGFSGEAVTQESLGRSPISANLFVAITT